MSSERNGHAEASSSNGGPSRKRAKTSDRVEMAYLGPPGTYGHQAAMLFARHMDESVDLIPCPNMTAIYNHPSPLLCMPFQNTLRGPVEETLDCLLSVLRHPSPNAKDEDSPASSNLEVPHVLADLALPIRHCLVVKRGTKMEDIRWVRSHEQALGQSADFLSTRLPLAATKRWPSTAGAALSLLNPSEEDIAEGPGAAICSKAVLEQHPELEVLYEGTQASADNYTRFILLSRHSDPSSPDLELKLAQLAKEDESRFWALPDLSSLSEITAQTGSHIHGIYSRPPPPDAATGNGEMWPTWYLVECSATYGEEGDQGKHGAVFLGRISYSRILG